MNKITLIIALMFLADNLIAQKIPTFTLRIDPDYARGGTVSQFFDSISFIPLETTEQSLFGTVDQLEVTDSFFIILDRRSRSVLVFTTTGKFHARIKTGGPDDLFGYFTIDRDHRTIIISNNYANALLLYDFDGNLVEKKTCPLHLVSLYRFENNNVLYNIDRPTNPDEAQATLFDLALSKGYDSVIRNLHPYRPKAEDGGFNIMCNPVTASEPNGHAIFSLPFDYNAYEIGDAGIVGQYSFVFPLQYSLPLHFAVDSSFKGQRLSYAYSNPENYKKISGIEQLYKEGDCLFFTARSGLMKLGNDWHYAYNLKTGTLLSFSRVTGDSASYYIPMLSSLLENIDALYSGKIYSSIASIRLLAFKKGIGGRKVIYPDVLQQFFSSATKANNPVLVRSTFKPNF